VPTIQSRLTSYVSLPEAVRQVKADEMAFRVADLTLLVTLGFDYIKPFERSVGRNTRGTRVTRVAEQVAASAPSG